MYENAFNAQSIGADVEIDRARGGVLKITLNIPSQTYTTTGACSGGKVTTKAMTVECVIDIEKLPLVNTAGYKIEEEQVGPDVLPYPPDPLTFDFG